jgi:hypothetical protein
MLNAKEYYRDAKTKQVIKTYKNGSWFSGKQTEGKLTLAIITEQKSIINITLMRFTWVLTMVGLF